MKYDVIVVFTLHGNENTVVIAEGKEPDEAQDIVSELFDDVYFKHVVSKEEVYLIPHCHVKHVLIRLVK